MPHKKHQFKVADFLAFVNPELKRTDESATDDYKKGLCTALEKVLKTCHWDISYTYNYWDEKGYIKWQQAGSPYQDESVKKKFMLGPSEQEFNRNYK